MKRLSFLLLVFLSAIAVAALGAVAFHRALAGFQPLGFEAQRAGGGWNVTRVTAAETGLAPGDQLLLVDGQPPDSLGSRLKGSATAELDVLRGAEVLKVTYQRPGLNINWAYLVLAAIGTMYLLIGAYTALSTRSSRAARLFYGWTLASAVIYLLTPSGVTDATGRALYLIEELARAILPPLTLHLFLIFPQPLARLDQPRRGVLLLPFLYVPAAVLVAVHATLLFGTGAMIRLATAESWLALLDRVMPIHLVVYSVAALGVLAFRLSRRQEDREAVRQLQWLVVGLAAGYTPFVALYLVPFTFGFGLPQPIAVAAVAPLALVPLTFAWAILRYRLWDIGPIVREATSTVLTVLLAGTVFSGAHLAVTRGVPEQLGVLRDFLTFGSGLAIAGLLVPARRRIASTLERLQYGRALAKRQALERLGRELLHERDLGRLCSELLADVAEGIDVERANLYLMSGRERLSPILPESLGPTEIDLRDTAPELWHRDVEILHGVALTGGAPALEERLFRAGYRCVFPLTVREVRLGLLVTGHRRDEEPLSSDDLALVRQLLSGAALAIENAKLLDELHRQLDEIGRLQRFSEGIIQSSPAGIVVIGPDRRIVSANGAFARLFGQSAETVCGLPIHEVLPVEPLPELGAQLVEVSYTDDAGGERTLQISNAGFNGAVAPAERDLSVLVVYDVSERVAMERALREKDRLAALGLLAAGVAHEVNTPITGISSYAQMLLADTPETDPRHEILKKVERQTFRASRIVNNLLDFARHRTDERRVVDLTPLLRETFDLLDERRSRRSVRLDLQLPDAPLRVWGSDGELQQVFTNLALNALDAMPNGGTLTVLAQDAGNKVLITVRDTGVGIPAEKLEKIFEPFYSTKLAQGGTGLGLAICVDLVRRHGGEMRATSAPGEGACFTVELPHLPTEALAAPPAAELPAEQTP